MENKKYKVYISIYGDTFDKIGEADTFVQARRLGMIEYGKYKSSLSAAIKIEDVVDRSNTVLRQNAFGQLLVTFDEGLVLDKVK